MYVWRHELAAVGWGLGMGQAETVVCTMFRLVPVLLRSFGAYLEMSFPFFFQRIEISNTSFKTYLRVIIIII